MQTCPGRPGTCSSGASPPSALGQLLGAQGSYDLRSGGLVVRFRAGETRCGRFACASAWALALLAAPAVFRRASSEFDRSRGRRGLRILGRAGDFWSDAFLWLGAAHSFFKPTIVVRRE